MSGQPAGDRVPLTPRQRLKRLAATGGVDSIAPLWKPIALGLHRRKLARDAAYRQWCETVGWQAVAEHWGPHDLLADEFSRLHVASQPYEITELLKRRIGELRDNRVLDAGASDGLFLRRIGARNGAGINLLEQCVARIREDGYEAWVGNVERMPFDDRSFPIVLCCETLEHVPNPIAALNELSRVCSGRIYLTIPLVSRTRISARPRGWPDAESHIFEFSEGDFARVVSHAGVRVVHQDRVQVFPEPSNPLVQLWLRLLMYPNYFPRLQYYELEPVASRR
jgi:SAM-dependent methyltransferase